ncbi:hypothetical protein PybrP1_009200 [[Pythium] brassicae (nom. inval.)]|nr:hypothetical protein PybrP1_009200 [[Pythium] brassicae (nom. inval.)]
MSSTSSDEDDGDYVPTEGTGLAVCHVDEPQPLAGGDPGEAAADPTRAAPARVNELWRDINASTDVSQRAADKSAKLLRALISRKQPPAKKKRKLLEFQAPVLSVDAKRTRADLLGANAAAAKVQQVVKFAGVEYSVTTRASRPAKAAGSSGVDHVLASLDGPKKVSTIEKSSLDWDQFKEAEGIEDELRQYTKNGYLEKQDFLTRVDRNQFEREKAERDKKRKLLQQNHPS